MRWIVGLVFALQSAVAWAEPARLASDGHAAWPIVLGEALSQEPSYREVAIGYGQAEFVEVASAERLAEAAATLADYLKRMSGATFEVSRGDGTRGIALGLFSDFPSLGLGNRFDPSDVLRTEEYLIRSHADGLWIIGATELAVEHAVWDLLHRLGYRQFFPGQTWEVIPRAQELTIEVDQFEKPDYHSRLIWYGMGRTDYNTQPYREWIARNRAVAGFRLNTSHEYGSLQKRHAEAFAAHPEYYALVKGERPKGTHAKFSAAEPGLQELVKRDAVAWFEANPRAVSKSMDPSDFGGWPTEGPSFELGSPTDQAVTLANRAAEAAAEAFDEARYIGMYAYYDHQAPPSVEVHPRVVVSFATRFLKPGVTVDQLIDGWRESGVEMFGIREYYSCWIWDFDVPDLSVQGGSLDYLRRTIPAFHAQGAAFLTSEASDNWGPAGLGYYVASRLLWDVSEADDVDAIVDDFLDKAFGAAQEPMRRFYALINGEDRPLLRQGMTGRMYRLLDEARKLAADDPGVMARLDDLVLYTRFLELYSRIETATDDAARQTAYEQHVRHAYRMRRSMMVHVAPLYDREYLKRTYTSLEIPAEAKWEVPEPANPWKSSEPFTADELEAFIAKGLKEDDRQRRADTGYALVGGSAPQPLNYETPMLRDAATVLLHAPRPETLSFEVNCIALGFSEGPAFAVQDPSGRVVYTGRVEVGDYQAHRFQADRPGTYKVAFEGSPNGVKVRAASPMAIEAIDRMGTAGRVHFKRPRTRLYFSVPQGVERVAVKVLGQGKGEFVSAALLDPSGQRVSEVAQASGVEPGELAAQRHGALDRATWSIELAKPASGYFGDVYLEMDSALTPTLSPHPAGVFEARSTAEID